jgi:hypothetical protein
LEHAVNFGDIGRILETILLVLLDPMTSRIAIHYLPLLKSKRKVAKKVSSDVTQKVNEDEEEGESTMLIYS